LLGHFNATGVMKNVLKSTTGNGSLQEISYDNEVPVVNFATLKNLIVNSKMFPYHNIYKFAVISYCISAPCSIGFTLTQLHTSQCNFLNENQYGCISSIIAIPSNL
jgi:hypothetical protein